MNQLSTLVLGMSLAMAASFASANEAHHPAGAAQPDPAATASASISMTAGVIRKVDKDAGKITIKHGELKNLDMPPMTMVFRVQDPAMLEKVKAGDKISFVADKIGGQFTVTQMEASQ